MVKALKTIFIYLGVLLLAGVATIIFCAGFLFFYRDGNIFGIQYVSSNQTLYARPDEDISDLKTIEINSDKFDVYVRVNSGVSKVMGKMKCKAYGYAKTSKAQIGFWLDYNESTKVATFNSIQPSGWLNTNNSYIEIAIPQNVASYGYDLIINGKKADIEIGGKYSYTIGTLTVNSTKGDVALTNVNLTNAINANIGSGSLYIDNKCSTSGEIASSISLGSGVINYSKVDISKFSFGVIDIKSIKNGKIGIIQANELITDGNIDGGGSIEVGAVKFVDFSSLDTNILINNIIGNGEGSSSRVNITGYGDIFINRAKCDLVINGHNGNISLNLCTGVISVITNQGDIKITDALKLVSAVSSYGNINIEFSNSALDYVVDSDSNDDKNRAVIASTKSGHIYVKGLQFGNISATDNGRITLDYNRIVGDNIVSAKSGVVNIVVPSPSSSTPANKYAFNLQVSSEVVTDIKVGVVGSIGTTVDYAGSGTQSFTNIYNSASSTDNNLRVFSTTGKIKIRSMDLMGY